MYKFCENEKSLSECEQIDPKTKAKFSDYQMRNSGLYFLDNGGLMLKDAWGSAIVMEGGDIYLQPARDLVAQPMRHMVGKIGHSLQMAAKKHIDFSSTEEGFRLKTQKVQHYYSKEQGIIMQSDASSDSPPTPQDEAYDQFGGILMLSKQAGVYTYGKKIFNESQDNSLYKAKNYLTLQSTDSDIWVLPEGSLYLWPTENLFATTENGTLMLLTDGTAMFGGAQSTIIGQKGQTVGMIPHPGSLPAILDGVLEISSIVAFLILSILPKTLKSSSLRFLPIPVILSSVDLMRFFPRNCL